MIAKQLARIFPVLLGLALVAAIACGGAPAAPDPTPVPATEPTPVPLAEATPTPAPPTAATPTGTLNVGLPETGRFTAHPLLTELPANITVTAIPIGEAFERLNIYTEPEAWLLESWDVSADSTTWTFNLRQGVQFHKGYGEMTAEDVVWSFQEGWAQNERHPRTNQLRAFWAHPQGYVETPGDYTVVVNTGVPLSLAIQQDEWILPAGGAVTWVASKRQTDEIGVEAADQNIASTGPWEIVEHRTGQFWRMRAVEDHWRQTPYFEELVLWDIPEESARLAGFQTGNLDTFTMAFDSIPLVEAVPGARLANIAESTEYALHIFGNFHVETLQGNPRDAYDPDLPWISASADVDSEEWQQAVKVRQALIYAIDREAILDTILGGFGRLGILRGWSLNEHQLGDRRWEYDPDRARKLLAEAGYADGFDITLTPSIRNAPAEVEICEAISTMWADIGINVRLQRIPYETFYATVVGRTYNGATCWAHSPGLLSTRALGVFNPDNVIPMGASHPYITDKYVQIYATVDDAERQRLETEAGAFIFDNALTTFGLFVGDAVWPIGPRIEDWTEQVNTRDLRFMNGFEFIRHRQ